jgi:hypothetical protein
MAMEFARSAAPRAADDSCVASAKQEFVLFHPDPRDDAMHVKLMRAAARLRANLRSGTP